MTELAQNSGVSYLMAPLAGWLVAGALKFAINSVRSGRLAWRQVGYGGMPSTHTAIVSSTAVFIGLRAGWNTAAFGVAAAVCLVVMMDAMDLRGHIGAQARALNALLADRPGHRALRERIGHHWTEVLGGLVVGSACAMGLSFLVG